ncbi:Imm72 family immunity protein [Cupriavidus alkaliphilus]|uniref:Imm72 family immunity protein n=1 Tax=Cupriavidus alkaliphilus TaxID=942866 RepID=UPI0035D4A131
MLRNLGREEKGLPATWRLLWRDSRYEDGLFPDEENCYRFLMPRDKEFQKGRQFRKT